MAKKVVIQVVSTETRLMPRVKDDALAIKITTDSDPDAIAAQFQALGNAVTEWIERERGYARPVASEPAAEMEAKANANALTSADLGTAPATEPVAEAATEPAAAPATEPATAATSEPAGIDATGGDEETGDDGGDGIEVGDAELAEPDEIERARGANKD